MAKELQDEEFELLLADKQHKEMTGAIKSLVVTMKNEESKRLLIIQQINQGINVFLNKVSELTKHPDIEIKSPDVIVNSNFDQYIVEVQESNKIGQQIIEGQNKIIEALGRKPKGLKIDRNGIGTINYIEIRY